ncbi:hypothetical protein CEP52_012439 [Fusarium oligoseptatum]|uniref:Uncharacterized protein n=1 Tax=Fusarium oligoseptatum TaxID=2604345 RepID=A0A428SY85_9HYPO|nr:hypothetical protein CEP52_012439 [Fusarium oligoseptatum]
MKKQQDDIFDDYAFIMRKAGKWMDEQKVKIEKMERDCAQLRAQAAELEGEV